MKIPILILGAGGHARVLLEIIRKLGLEFKGVATPDRKPGEIFFGFPVLGDDDAVLSFPTNEVHLVNGLGSTGLLGRRKILFEKFKSKGYSFPPLIHPSAVVAQDVEISEGVQVMAGVVIQPGVFIGKNTIINTNSTIDHDCKIGDHVHIAPGSTLSGEVVLEDCVHIGTGANLIQNVFIGKNSLVGAGTLVIRNVPEQQLVFGVPARLAKTIREWKNILIPPDISIRQAIKIIENEGLRVAFVVKDNDFLLGILTDGDIRRAILSGVSLDDQVKKVMNSNPITVGGNDGREVLLSLMKSKSIHQVPVVDSNGRIIRVEFMENLILSPIS